MSSANDRRIAQVASRQAGHATRAQLVEAGMTQRTIARRVHAGDLVQVGRRTFRSSVVPRSPRGDVVAACLDVGGVASHWTAAWLHDLVEPRSSIDVTVRRTGPMYERVARWPEQPRMRVHSSTNLPSDDIVPVGAIPTTSVARTALGLAALVPSEVSHRRLGELISKMVDEQRATDPWLWWLLERRRCRGRNGVLELESVLAERALLGPTESWLERELLSLVRSAGLPAPSTQQRIGSRGRFVARVDFLYAERRVVVEALGYAHHRTKAQLEADTTRANELQLQGFVVLQFSFEQIVRSPASVVATIRRALGLQAANVAA